MHKRQLSRSEIRAVHRRLRRWGRDLRTEEFANWHLDRELPRRAWRKANQRQRLVLVYGTVAAAFLTIAAAQRLPDLSGLPPLSYFGMPGPRIHVEAAAATATASALAGPVEIAFTGEPRANVMAAPDSALTDLQPEVSIIAQADTAFTAPIDQWEWDGQQGARSTAKVASLANAETLARHASKASVIVAGRVEAVAADALVVRVELALRGETSEVLRIPVTEDPGALARLRAGSRVLAYLAAPDDPVETETPVGEASSLRPAGPGALIELSTLTDPKR